MPDSLSEFRGRSFDYANLTSVDSWGDFDLGAFNEMQDTDSLLKTKQVGIRLGDLDLLEMTAPIQLLEVDFYKDTCAKPTVYL